MLENTRAFEVWFRGYATGRCGCERRYSTVADRESPSGRVGRAGGMQEGCTPEDGLSYYATEWDDNAIRSHRPGGLWLRGVDETEDGCVDGKRKTSAS